MHSSLEMSYWVYITTNYEKTVLYTGFTNNLVRRMNEHEEAREIRKGFTGKYGARYLLYSESFEDPSSAILREKQIKRWNREKKLNLIATKNPNQDFLDPATLV